MTDTERKQNVILGMVVKKNEKKELSINPMKTFCLHRVYQQWKRAKLRTMD